ncbi:MAG: ATP-binding protein [Mariniphaga sp.]|nr:ATP-binding protein [Mariniphaga sp.]
MASKNLYRNIIIKCCLLAGSALLLAWLFFEQQSLVPGIFVAIVFVIQIAELIHFLNRTNRQIAFFFDAIQNDDSTLRFPETTATKSLNDLNSSLNRMNEQIKSVKFELQEQEQYFKTILEHVSVGIIVYNEKGNIFLSNSAARNLLDYEPLTHINQLMRVDKNLFAAFKDLQPGNRKMVSFSGKKGMRQLSLKSTLFKTSGENLHLVAVQDIKSELETKELESWIKLIRVLTHEIMNSVAPITSLSETILGYYKNNDGTMPSEKIIGNTIKGLEVINERGAGLISFVENYRKFTRIPPPEKKMLIVGQLFDNTITLINMEAGNEKITISHEVNPPDLEVLADKKQISQVLINLVKNAKEALKDSRDGKITLTGENNRNGRPQITVADNGPGISSDLMDKIFVPFFTTRESGTGIGLSISRQIMLLHGGSLKIISKPGETTQAILEF